MVGTGKDEGPMAPSRIKIADLDEKSLAKLRALEGNLDVCLVALEPAYQLAELSENQLKAIKAGEDEMGVVLLAYRCE
jgi:hypothetical protein